MYRILLDYGHGENTPGKRSPDGQFREYAYAREVGRRIAKGLQEELGLCIHEIITEDVDISLTERCNRVNNIVKTYPQDECFLVSIHSNAAGNCSEWMNARGWQIHVHTQASAKSKEIANSFSQAVQLMNLKIRKPKPTQNYWQNNFKILRDTKCPAVLTENFFYDNKEDLKFLMSEEGKQAVVDLHILGICSYIGIPYAVVTPW